MKRIVGLILLMAVILLPVTYAQDVTKEAKKAFQDLEYKAALKKAAKAKKPVMIDFYATWCGPCKQLDARTFSDDDVEKFLKSKVIAIKVDIDKNRDLAAKYEVKAIPCLVFIDGEGKEVDRILGYRGPKKFLDAAKTMLKKN